MTGRILLLLVVTWVVISSAGCIGRCSWDYDDPNNHDVTIVDIRELEGDDGVFTYEIDLSGPSFGMTLFFNQDQYESCIIDNNHEIGEEVRAQVVPGGGCEGHYRISDCDFWV